MSVRVRFIVTLGLLAAVAAVAAGLWHVVGRRGPALPETWTEVARPPVIRPDYVGVTLPPNIAPLNFTVAEDGTAYAVKVHGAAGEAIEIASSSAGIRIPADRWRALLAANRGHDVLFEVYVRVAGGRWQHFETILNRVASEPIDSHLVYRRIKPMYNFFGPIGIYQRDLETFDETTVLDNNGFDNHQKGCPNCHTFRNNRADEMIMHVRGPSGGMLLLEGESLVKLDTRTKVTPRPGAFSAWHPTRPLIAFSMNSVRQFFHPARPEVRDAYDLDSDLAVYHTDTRKLVSTAAIRQEDLLETFPAWSAEGDALYFCSARKLWGDKPQQPPARYREVKYDLMRVPYDAETGTWGDVETVLSAAATGRSILQPRTSPDGRWLLCAMCQYSMQPSFQPDSDLYLLDLKTRDLRPLECNSPLSESWHSWSSNSRWIAFTSKRGDGQFGRAYFSYIDERGRAAKPFILPQEDPEFYESSIMLYQLPELVTSAIPVDGDTFLHVVRNTGTAQSDAITGASRAGGKAASAGRPR